MIIFTKKTIYKFTSVRVDQTHRRSLLFHFQYVDNSTVRNRLTRPPPNVQSCVLIHLRRNATENHHEIWVNIVFQIKEKKKTTNILLCMVTVFGRYDQHVSTERFLACLRTSTLWTRAPNFRRPKCQNADRNSQDVRKIYGRWQIDHQPWLANRLALLSSIQTD